MKYWAYINNEILGPYEKEKLLELPVFTASTLLCPQTPVGEKTEEWKEASTYPEVAALLKPSGTPVSGPQNDPPSPQKNDLPEGALSQPAMSSQTDQSGAPDTNALDGTPPAQVPDPGLSNTGRKLNTLTPHAIDPTPPPSQSINSAFEVNHLGPAKNEPKKDERSYSSANFDPLTISQIGRRAVPLPADGAAPAASPDGQPPEIFIPPAAQQPNPAASPSLEPFSPALEANKESAPGSVPYASSADKNTVDGVNAKLDATARLEDINLKLETTARTGATKQDIEQLKEKLGQMGEVLTSIKNSQAQQEIIEHVQRLAHSVAEIKEILAQRPAAAPQTVHISQDNGSFPASPAGKEEPSRLVAEPRLPKTGTETLIVDHGSKGKGSRLGGFIKKTFSFFLFLLALVAILGGAVLALKHFGGPDLTRFLPFRTDAADARPEQPPVQPGGETPGATAGDQQLAAPAQSTAPQKDISPEIIYFGRTYSLKKGGSTLENKVYEDAVFKKGNFNKASWQARELPNGAFELTANIPLLGDTGRLSYRYEVDYTQKTIMPLDAMSQKPLSALLDKKQAAPAPVKGRKNSARSSLKAKPAAKRGAGQTVVKPAVQDDDEYEYVYED